MNTVEVADRVVVELKDLGAYLYYSARRSKSVYVKFKDPLVRSLTIRDHDTIEKYKYKWNIRLDGRETEVIMDRGIERFFYEVKDLDKFYEDIRKYQKQIITYNKLGEKKKFKVSSESDVQY